MADYVTVRRPAEWGARRRRVLKLPTLIRDDRYFTLQLAESYLTPRLFGQILGLIERLARHPT